MWDAVQADDRLLAVGGCNSRLVLFFAISFYTDDEFEKVGRIGIAEMKQSI